MRDLPAYDIVAQGNVRHDEHYRLPYTPSCPCGAALWATSVQSLYAVTGILLALYNRERTGQGQYVDIAMLDSVFAFIETNIVRHTIGGVHPTRVGARHPLSAPSAFTCARTPMSSLPWPATTPLRQAVRDHRPARSDQESKV